MASLVVKLLLATSGLTSLCYAQHADKADENKASVLNEPHEVRMPDFDELRLLFARDDSTAFQDAVQVLQGDDSPTLEELPGIINDWKAGEITQYLGDHQFTTISSIGNFTFSIPNSGTITSVIYAWHEKNGSSGTSSALIISETVGKFGTVEYNTGNCLFSQVKYHTRGDSVSLQGYTQGSFLGKNPAGSFVPYGSYVGSSEGKITLGSKSEYLLQTLGIMDTESYYSKTVTTAIGDEAETRYDMHSVTGGTNGTINISSLYSGENDSLIHMNIELFNSDSEATAESFIKVSTPIHSDSGPISEGTIQLFFMSMHTTVGLYLP